MKLCFSIAGEAEVPAIAQLATRVDRHLRERQGRAIPKSPVKETTVLNLMKTSRILLARFESQTIAMLCLATKKPWAIDPAYFTKATRPLYLTNMAVAPVWQRRGVGRKILDEASARARAWPADAIRLDAYDNETGAGGFYAKCGYREAGRVVYRQRPLIYFEMLL